MVKSEQEQINENARKRARRIASKLKLPKICNNCDSEEEIFLCFRDNDLQNADSKNLYYLCKSCNEVRRFPDGRKREDYTRCQICEKIRLCANSCLCSAEPSNLTTCFPNRSLICLNVPNCTIIAYFW